MKIVMKCKLCKLDKSLKSFWDYDSFKPICTKCSLKKEIHYFNEKDKIKEIVLNILTIEKNRKNKKKIYPKEFKEKRKNIMQSWFCTECWSNEYLQVHHIDKNINNNFDDNLKLLCYYCHSKYHKHMQWKNPPKWLKRTRH